MISAFLDTWASLAYMQSGFSYAILSMTLKAFRMLMSKFTTLVEDNDPPLPVVARAKKKSCFNLTVLCAIRFLN